MQRKHRTHITEQTDPSKKGDPKTFVFCRGKHGVSLLELSDFMELFFGCPAAALLLCCGMCNRGRHWLLNNPNTATCCSSS